MALTEPVTVREPIPAPASGPRRPLLSRVSTGHVAMVLAGLVAVLLNLAVLRSDGASLAVATARTDLQPGTVLSEGSVTAVTLGDAAALRSGLVTMEAVAALYGSVIGRPLAAGEPLRRSDLRPTAVASGLREYSVAVASAEAAGGLIQPADVVDVIATVDGRTFYVAAGLDVVQVAREGSGLDVGDDLVIVLAVDDRTALELASAQASGSIVIVRATGAAPPLPSADSPDQPEAP